MASSELASQTGLPKPTVAKVLKILSRKTVVTATRGAAGGYTLSRPPSDLNARQLIEAVEGPIGVAECVGETPHQCCYLGDCALEKTWRKINDVICGALESLSVAQMAKLDEENLVQLRQRLQGSPPACPTSDTTNGDPSTSVRINGTQDNGVRHGASVNSEANDL